MVGGAMMGGAIVGGARMGGAMMEGARMEGARTGRGSVVFSWQVLLCDVHLLPLFGLFLLTLFYPLGYPPQWIVGVGYSQEKMG